MVKRRRKSKRGQGTRAVIGKGAHAAKKVVNGTGRAVKGIGRSIRKIF